MIQEQDHGASLLSSIATGIYWLSIAVAVGWIILTRDPSTTVILAVVVIAVIAGALPLEKRAGSLRMKAVSWQVNHDSLTGLANRSRFMGELSRQLRRKRSRASSVAVLLLDLDRFKTINDTIGHAAGDELLREVGSRLQRLASRFVIIGRLGGDEFAIVTEVSTREDLQEIGKEVVGTLNFHTTLNSQPVWINGSVGAAIAEFPRPTLAELMSMADIALYQAKAAGRNRAVVFEPHRPMPTVHELSMDYELRLSLERNQMLLYYQPVLDLKTGQIHGFEALVRWAHPSFGFLGPEHFIPLAEENGIIHHLGRWIVEEACQRTLEWHRVFGDSINISINLSALQFAREDIVAEVQDILDSSGINPEHVILEITETALGHDEATTLENIKGLREAGVGIAVDDFGTGYSSLNYLKRYPADYLKIDKSFLEDVDDERSFGIIRAAIDVGHVLGMKVVAEGVESPTQLKWLIKAGCDFAQGYLFSKPLKSVDVTNLLIEAMRQKPEMELPLSA